MTAVRSRPCSTLSYSPFSPFGQQYQFCFFPILPFSKLSQKSNAKDVTVQLCQAPWTLNASREASHVLKHHFSNIAIPQNAQGESMLHKQAEPVTSLLNRTDPSQPEFITVTSLCATCLFPSTFIRTASDRKPRKTLYMSNSNSLLLEAVPEVDLNPRPSSSRKLLCIKTTCKSLADYVKKC